MKLPNSTQLGLAVAAVLAGHALAAGASNANPPPPAHGGLQVQITTGRISVVQPAVPAAATNSATSGKAVVVPPPPGLPVSGLVLNQSNRDLDVPFASDDAAKRQFDFALFDSTGTQIWDSNADLSEGTETDAILHKQQAWKRTIMVPLVIDGTPLATGVYSVEMSVGEAKGIGAVATFEVVAPSATGTGGNTNGGGNGQPPPPSGGGMGPGTSPAAGSGGGGQTPPPGGGTSTGSGPGTGAGGGQTPPAPGSGAGAGPGSGSGNNGQTPPPPGSGTGSGSGSSTGTGGGQRPPPPGGGGNPGATGPAA